MVLATSLLRIARGTLWGAVVCCSLAADTAHAEILPWLRQTIDDPFSMEKKAADQVASGLRPDSCQIPDIKSKLTLDDVVISALCNNPDTKGAYLSLVAQAASYVSNYSSYLPTVSGSMSHSRNTSINVHSKSTTVSSAYGLSLGLTLYDFGQREFKLETAELAFRSAGNSYNSTLQGTIASALQGYYSLLRAQNALAVAKQSEEFAKESYEAALLRHQIGQVPLADQLQAKGSYSQALLGTEAADNGLALAQAAMAQIMGFSPETPVEVKDIDNKTLAIDPFADELPALIEKAKEKRYDLQSSRNALKSSEISLKALKRSQLATISATANMGLSNDDIHIYNYNRSRSQGVGVSVSIPIFTGFSQTYSLHATEKSLETQRESLITTERNVEKDVWNSWHNYETSKLSWKTSQDQIATAIQLKELALGRYKEGLGSILDVLNAQLQYSNALQSQLQNRYSLLTSRVDLVRSVGVLDLASVNPKVVQQSAVSDTVSDTVTANTAIKEDTAKTTAATDTMSATDITKAADTTTTHSVH